MIIKVLKNAFRVNLRDDNKTGFVQKDGRTLYWFKIDSSENIIYFRDPGYRREFIPQVPNYVNKNLLAFIKDMKLLEKTKRWMNNMEGDAHGDHSIGYRNLIIEGPKNYRLSGD